MRRFHTWALLVLLTLCLPQMTVPALADNCIDCHSAWEEDHDSPSKTFPTDVHRQAGLGCSDCHGGDPALEDMDEVRESSGYLGVPATLEIPEFCARCHGDPAYMVKHNPGLPTDQLEKYRTSVHGQQLFGNEDTKVATCVSCHTAHRIEKAEIPTSSVYAGNIPQTCARCHANGEYMAGYGIPTNQYEDYIASVHGRALLEMDDRAAPACNDCHGNHAATPPGVTSLSAVCGLCHALIAENFSVSPHQEAFEDMGLPQCETCHDKHRIVEPQLDWVGTGEKALCVECHSEDDGTGGYATARELHSMLARIDSSYQAATRLVDEADAKGMMVVDERRLLKEVNQASIQAATEMHTFDTVKVTAVVEAGLATAAVIDSSSATKIDEYYFRRKGLGVASLLITILVVALFLRIRAIEKQSDTSVRTSKKNL